MTIVNRDRGGARTQVVHARLISSKCNRTMNPASACFAALGTTAEVTILDAAALADAIDVLEGELAAIDLACSRFRDDSELSHLVRNHGRWMSASPLLRQALQAGIDAAAATDGAVDPTVGASMRALGWDADFAVVVARRDPVRIERVPAGGWRLIEIDNERGRIRIPAGIEIDLGSIAKALAGDRAAAAIHRRTGSSTLVSLGGDVAVAGPAPAGGWPVLVTDDHRSGPAASGQVIAITTGGLATSSTTARRWRTTDGLAHHIVNPATGLPAAEVWRTVSVSAATCVDANAAATAAIVKGEEAPRWLESLDLPARLVGANGCIALTGSWPAPEAATVHAA